jgi:uncharacterized membrane protein
MGFAGLIYLFLGLFFVRGEIGASRGREKLVALGSVFIAASLAVFAPEHFQGPQFVQSMVPSWMPAHLFWAYFVGCALLAAATSLALGKCVRLSTTLLGLMFFLFVCMIYIPYVHAHPADRFSWAYALRDLSFAAGGWALAGLYSRVSSPRQSVWMITFARVVLAVAAIYYAFENFLHPDFDPGVPLEERIPPWVPFASACGYLSGAVLIVAGMGLILNKRSRMAATAIGALMTVLTLYPYLLILFHSRGGSPTEINDALNYVADMLLYAGAALALASALPRESGSVEKAAGECSLAKS